MNKTSIFTDGPNGLYIHFPFCISKCNYCDFYSINYSDELLQQYLAALFLEIDLYENCYSKEIATVYIGGGTPSLLEPEYLARLMDKIYSSFIISKKAEITMESNPSSLNREKLLLYKKAGINRLSLGVQSFNDWELQLLGRLHDSRTAINIINHVAEIFDNYNLDLIFALPGQKKKDWQDTLDIVLNFNPPHLSLYNLQIEKETPFYKMYKQGELELIDEEIDADIYLESRENLLAEGYQQYEISNYAKKGFQSHHNKLYWEFKPYLGLGPAAHSFDGLSRFYNYSSLKLYINKLKDGKLPTAEFVRLRRSELMSEMLFMGLRQLKGINPAEFKERFSVSLVDIYGKAIAKLLDKELIEYSNERLHLTENGLLLGNEVFMEFLL